MPGETTIPDEYLTAIGRVAVAWSRLETVLHIALITVFGKPKDDGRAHAVFAHMAFPQKLDALSAMIAMCDLPPGHPCLNYRETVQPQLKEAATARNAVLHQQWLHVNGVVTRSSFDARGTLKFKETPVSLEELQAASELIDNAGKTLLAAVKFSKFSPQSGQ